MAVYGYARVSTRAQAELGESLEVQQRHIDGHATTKDLVVDRMFVERGVSGSVPFLDRPEGKILMRTLRPGDTIITAKLDRMFRSALDALEVLGKLKTIGVALHMIDLGGDVTGNGISKLVFTILSAVAEAERDRIRERISTVKADQKTRGRYLGGKVPFGFEIGQDGDLKPVPTQQAAICTVASMRAQGRTLRAIRTTLAEGGTILSLDAVHRIAKEQDATSAP